ncbi:MAG: hypothetical protein ACFE94_07120 [Candidatus Hodarchaeota archaeon]
MTIRKLIKNVLERVIKIFSIFVLYSSVLVGILAPMLLIVGGFFKFLDHFHWISWFFADPTTYSKDLIVCWLNSVLHCSFFYSDTWVYLNVMIFVAGLILFIISLACLVIGIRKNAGLVQERIYKHIRHPQNFSIIIMAFPLFFYRYGFRLGDFISWIQFIFLIIIYSDLGDIKLKKKYPEEFQSYYENTGFFLPRIFPYRISYYFSAIYNKKYRYPFLLLIYILTIYVLYQLFLILPFYWATI